MKRKKIVILPEVNTCGGDLSKKWFIYFSYRDPRNDKMKRFKVYYGLHKIKDFGKRSEAALKLKEEYTQRLRNGWSPFLDDEKAIYEDQLQYSNIARIYGNMKSSNKTFNYYSSKYLKLLKDRGDMEKESLSTYTSTLRVFELWLAKNGQNGYDITAIDNEIVLLFFDILINKEMLSGQTIKRYRRLLRDVFEFAKKDNKRIVNPVYDVPDCKRVNDKAPRPISEFDIQDFKEAIIDRDPQLWLAISFEYYCFLRPGKELRKLRIGDIDFARGTIDVDAIRAKTNKERFPTIPVVFLKELREVYQLQQYPKHFYVFSKNGQPGETLIGKNNLRFRFRKIREEMNMPESYKLYSWKHTGNSRASDANIPLESLQGQNGHLSKTTTEIYMRHKIGRVDPIIRDRFPPL